MAKSTIVRRLKYSADDFQSFIEEASSLDPRDRRILLDFPTVYVVSSDEDEMFNVYVGETHSIRSRTAQHLAGDVKKKTWRDFKDHVKSNLFIIGNDNFNKSLTLDIENKLMLYMSSVPAVKRLHNARSNPQIDYYTRELLDDVFDEIWTSLRKLEPRLFPAETLIRDSALFKASPFHKLTSEQGWAKIEISEAINDALASEPEEPCLILVEGAAGAGKTVLLSSIFFDLVDGVGPDDPFEKQAVDAALLVNHDEQDVVYREIARKLGVLTARAPGGMQSVERVGKPTRFINGTDPDTKIEVALVDEAHLLWTQGKQSYRGRNMLVDIMDRAKVVVAVFDPMQVMGTNAYWEPDALESLRKRADRAICLNQQMRIHSSPETLEWIRGLIAKGVIKSVPSDPDYDLRIFDSPHALFEAVKGKANDLEMGLSRVLATFDWPYSSGKPAPEGGMWGVTVPDLSPEYSQESFTLPWNRQLPYKGPRGRKKELSWAEQEQTINECGSHFTIQGFDLNYAGVIIGPSVGYEDGKVVFRPDRSQNRHATQKRTMSGGEKASVAEELLRNELNVLLTRGVNGLYIYAVDENLREALVNAAQ